MMPAIEYPAYVTEILRRLENAEEEAYLVGGSLRDALLGLPAHDFDVATSALPEKTKALFPDRHVIETGMQHGTVTVVMDGFPVEITTFRIDGDYTDSRHPDRVLFTDRIAEDLSRRDFTVNAMAYHREKGLVDPFGGREDLAGRVIRAVREPRLRFSEDALRIMRAFRFSAQLGFEIEKETLRGIEAEKDGLCRIARERILSEWVRLLCSQGVTDAVTKMIETGVLPYVTKDFVPNKRALSALSQMPAEDVGRMGLFFVGMPEDELGTLLRELKCSQRQIKGTRAVARGALRAVTCAREATALRADTGIYAPLAVRASVLMGNSPADAIAMVENDRTPTEIGELAISGKDLMEMGLRGREIGETLEFLLGAVMEHPAYHNRETLIELVRRRNKEHE